MEIAGWMVLGLGVYLAVGVVFAVPFAFGLVGRVSPAARGAGLGFRLLIVPGCAALWPLMVWALVPGRVVEAAADFVDGEAGP